MSRYVRAIGPKTWLICGIAVALVSLVSLKANPSPGAVTTATAAESSAVAPNSPQSAGQSGAWKVEDCQTCHADATGQQFQHSNHGKLAQSCANCHSGVAEHAKAMVDGKTGVPTPTLKNKKPADLNAICLGCHEKNNQQNYNMSMHARRNVECISCHSIHSYKSVKAQLKTEDATETCYSCHPTMRAKMQRTSHHPVREGKMTCASCHNPHDGSRPKLLRADSTNELCYKCHTEKRGPFLFEHAPVRTDCATCHDPHGTNQDRLLVAKAPFLCQRCHYSAHGLTGDNSNTLYGPPVAAANPPGVTTTQTTRSSRQMERSCANCHFALHGSNSPSGWAFVR
jgi:DmsE family decaheme c-type cytochrome